LAKSGPTPLFVFTLVKYGLGKGTGRAETMAKKAWRI
jgi:hypothetical protein